ncbi:MAG: hypothetical protein ACRCWI_08810, partial [Brevinema sp.]
QEPSFISEPQDLELLYAGYISSNQRLYINPKTKEQFLKILIPIDDEDEILTPELFISEPEEKCWTIYYGDGCISSGRNSTNGLWYGLIMCEPDPPW